MCANILRFSFIMSVMFYSVCSAYSTRCKTGDAVTMRPNTSFFSPFIFTTLIFVLGIYREFPVSLLELICMYILQIEILNVDRAIALTRNKMHYLFISAFLFRTVSSKQLNLLLLSLLHVTRDMLL